MKKLMLPLSILVVFGFNNCGGFKILDGDFLESASLSTGDAVNSEKLKLPYALLSAEQTLNSMISVTGLPEANTALLREYDLRYSALAAGNNLGMINGPLLLGTTSMAGEACKDLVTRERNISSSERAFFTNINFGGSLTAVTSEAYGQSLRAMARSFWGRNETNEESTLLHAYHSSFVNDLPESERGRSSPINNLMISTCAAMLSSFDAISY